MSLIFVGDDCVHRRVAGDGIPAPSGSLMMEDTPETIGVDIVRIKLVGGVPTVFDYTPEQFDAKAENELFNESMLKIGRALFIHENRIRALEGKAPIDKATFITALRGL